ncbi:MAG: phosphatidate cytidylyltransferase, partial [Akkermansiaceae bacterium]|nr:phosphatidate cytidylyltransferase [Akkermansiaceae bacterium]
PVSAWITGVVAVLVVVTFPVIVLLHRLGRIGDELREELMKRTRSWAILAPAFIVPVLAGAAWTILCVMIIALLCYREYARATGLFREKSMSLLVVAGILVATFAVADHWYGFFMALGPLTIVVIAAAAILYDQPSGYIQRVGLSALAFLFFGISFGHIGYMANDPDYRPILLMLVVSVELNDIFAYLTGRTLGRRKLAPRTSPNKTVGGAAGAMILTSLLVGVLGHFVFAGTIMDDPLKLAGLGLIVSIAGQLGDLMLSSIKRDIGIKDMGVTLPGHGGFLDRFDSLILVGPAVFHYVGYFRGFGVEEPVRIITGGGS